jgi:hypothetical protein
MMSSPARRALWSRALTLIFLARGHSFVSGMVHGACLGTREPEIQKNISMEAFEKIEGWGE